MSFWTLPELTLHMIKTAHYANIVRASVVPAAPDPMTSADVTSSGPHAMTSSPPTVASSCSPVDSDSSRESDVDHENYFRAAAVGGSSFDFRFPSKRQREPSTGAGDDGSTMAKIWRPEAPLPTAPIFLPSSPADDRESPICEDFDNRTGPGRDSGTVTSSRSPEDRGGAARSPVRSEDVSDDGGAPRQPALTAMEDFISRSICELDRSKRRPAIPPLLPPAPPRVPAPPNGLPPPMSVADLMFPFFPLAQFFPDQFLLASRAFNFLPLMQSMARLYGDRFSGLDLPLGGAQTTTGDDLDAAKRPPRPRTPTQIGPDRKGEAAKSQRVNGGAPEMKPRAARDRSDNGPISDRLRGPTDRTSNSEGRSDAEDCQKFSPTSSEVPAVGSKSTALDSLRGFVYGDRKQSQHAPRADRKYFCGGHLRCRDDDEAARVRPRSDGDSVASPVGVDVPPSGGTDRTSDYDSRFDKYYRLARELAGQL